MDLLESMEKGTSWKEILYEVVTKQDFDPWNINVASLADAYIEKIREIKIVDFAVPGTVVLVGAVLVKLKSDIVSNNAIFLENYLDGVQQDIYDEMPTDISEIIGSNEIVQEVRSQPMLLVRRLPKRGVSLPELMTFLNRVIKQADRERVRARLESTENRIAVKVRKLALEKIMHNVYEQIKSYKGSKVPVRSLMEKQTREQFIWYLFPILHLANNNKIELYQKKMYDELYVSAN